MTIEEFAQLVCDRMNHEPTHQQRALIEALARFCSKEASPTGVFLLNGYAGTGKTSVVGALVQALALVRRDVVLLAPTGRAAKVLSRFSGRQAYTIHRKIYQGDIMSGGRSMNLAGNPHRNAVFIVDEASMIGDSSGDGNDSLLDDLVQYVYGYGDNCRMILLGDTAQLPPVGCDRSPAMSPAVLRGMGQKVTRAVLTATVRQASESGILYNSTRLRTIMAESLANNPEGPLPVPDLRFDSFPDVAVTTAQDLQDDLSTAYSTYGIDNTIVITRSNRRAMLFNLAIRSQILDRESYIERGEPLLIAKNNYHWAAKVRRGEFIANGDIATINTIYGYENRGFLRFADVSLSFADRDLTIDCKLILNSLNSETTALTAEHEQMLLNLALQGATPEQLNDPYKRTRILKADPYYNALRVKYAYTLTCHKSQGGQWDSVFIDMAGISDEATRTLNFYRWLYTAITRATTRLTFITDPRD